MTLESRHDFSSNQSKKPFFSPGCARDASGVRAGQSSHIDESQFKKYPPTDRIPTLGDPEGDDRSIGSSSGRPSVRRRRGIVPALGRRDTEKSHPRPTRASSRIDRRRRPTDAIEIDRHDTIVGQPSSRSDKRRHRGSNRTRDETWTTQRTRR